MTTPTPTAAIEQRDGEPDLNAEATEAHRQLAALAEATKPGSDTKASIDQLSVAAEASPLNIDELATWLGSGPIDVMRSI